MKDKEIVVKSQINFSNKKTNKTKTHKKTQMQPKTLLQM